MNDKWISSQSWMLTLLFWISTFLLLAIQFWLIGWGPRSTFTEDWLTLTGWFMLTLTEDWLTFTGWFMLTITEDWFTFTGWFIFTFTEEVLTLVGGKRLTFTEEVLTFVGGLRPMLIAMIDWLRYLFSCKFTFWAMCWMDSDVSRADSLLPNSS